MELSKELLAQVEMNLRADFDLDSEEIDDVMQTLVNRFGQLVGKLEKTDSLEESKATRDFVSDLVIWFNTSFISGSHMDYAGGAVAKAFANYKLVLEKCDENTLLMNKGFGKQRKNAINYERSSKQWYDTFQKLYK